MAAAMTRSFEIEVDPQPHQLNTGCIYIDRAEWKKGVGDTMQDKMNPIFSLIKISKKAYFISKIM
jgi:hypothetical protein